jgi:manganese-dependent ADP-ribose/CDP-alcohol diphosphatase
MHRAVTTFPTTRASVTLAIESLRLRRPSSSSASSSFVRVARRRSFGFERQYKMMMSTRATMSGEDGDPAVVPRFTFGLLTDIQYTDGPDRKNVTGTQMRRYRNSLRVAERAVEFFNAHELDFAVHNGDITDHQCAFDFASDDFKPVERGREDLGAVMRILSRAKCEDWVFTVGNHELYNFTREELRRGVSTDGSALDFKCADANGDFYYSFTPGDGWRVMVLDPYAVSIYRKGRQQGLCEEAVELLRRFNPNVDAFVRENPEVIETERMSGTFPYFKDMEGLDGRWVPFNGGLGKEQIAWARDTLRRAKESGEKVIILSHLLIHPFSTAKRSGKTLMWDYDEMLEVIEDESTRGCIKCVISGHQHEGANWTCDKTGIHYLAVESPMLAMDISPGPFAVVEVFDDEIRFKGYGRNEDSLIFPFDKDAPPKAPMVRSFPVAK